MNNLIINGIGHSKFDLEWAKRGGVLAVINTIGYGNTEYVEYLAKLLHFSNLDKKYGGVIHIQIYLGDNTWIDIEDVRMATPNECAEAGIEYIEPPAVWRETLNEAKNDD